MSWQARDEGRSRGKLGGPLSSDHSSLLVGGSELASEGSWEAPLVYWEVNTGSRDSFRLIYFLEILFSFMSQALI